MKVNWNFVVIVIGIVEMTLIVTVFAFKEATSIKPTETLLGNESISIVHDSKRNVTCYKSHGGLSCIKD